MSEEKQVDYQPLLSSEELGRIIRETSHKLGYHGYYEDRKAVARACARVVLEYSVEDGGRYPDKWDSRWVKACQEALADMADMILLEDI